MLAKYKKHIIIAAAILLCLVTTLVVVLVTVGNKPTEPVDPATSPEIKKEVLFDIPLEDVASISVHNSYGEFEVVSKSPYIFEIKDFDIPVDSEVLLTFTVFTASVSYDMTVAENADDLEQYGLEGRTFTTP